MLSDEFKGSFQIEGEAPQPCGDRPAHVLGCGDGRCVCLALPDSSAHVQSALSGLGAVAGPHRERVQSREARQAQPLRSRELRGLAASLFSFLMKGVSCIALRSQ